MKQGNHSWKPKCSDNLRNENRPLRKTRTVGLGTSAAFPSMGELISLDRDEVDVSNLQSLEQIPRELKPNLIISASVYTEVDRAETKAELAMKINAVAPGLMAEVARKLRAVLSIIQLNMCLMIKGINLIPKMIRLTHSVYIGKASW
jgi:hypothetical protein